MFCLGGRPPGRALRPFNVLPRSPITIVIFLIYKKETSLNFNIYLHSINFNFIVLRLIQKNINCINIDNYKYQRPTQIPNEIVTKNPSSRPYFSAQRRHSCRQRPLPNHNIIIQSSHCIHSLATQSRNSCSVSRDSTLYSRDISPAVCSYRCGC